MPETDDLILEVGRVTAVARYVPRREQIHGDEGRHIETEDAFDDYAMTALYEQSEFLRKVLRDALGNDYTVTRLSVETANSVEVIAVIGVAYKLLKDFNEVMDTLSKARDHLVNVVHSIIYGQTPAEWYDFVVTGRVATPTGQLPEVQAPAPVQQNPPTAASTRLVRQFSSPRPPVHWDRDAFLSRFVIPLSFATVLVGLAIGLIAAIRHI
jgi:hypothetical protein